MHAKTTQPWPEIPDTYPVLVQARVGCINLIKNHLSELGPVTEKVHTIDFCVWKTDVPADNPIHAKLKVEHKLDGVAGVQSIKV